MNNRTRSFSSAAAVTGMFLVTMALTTFLHAGGDKYSPRITSMGRSFTASSRGLDAVGMNPANLALNDRDATITINVMPLGLSIGSDMLNLEIYNKFFTGEPKIDPITGQTVYENGKEVRVGKELSDKDKEEILGLFPSGIARTQFGTELSPIGISIQAGSFGFAFVPSVQMVVNQDMPKGYLQFLLNGFAPEGSTYDLSGTAINASAVAEANFSAAYMLPISTADIDEVTIGVGAKYLIGIGYIITDRYTSSISNSPLVITQDPGKSLTTLNANFDFLQFTAIPDASSPEPVGTGLGFDVGISAFLFNSVRFGASVTDIGSITWDKQTKAVIGSANLNIEGIAETAAQESLKTAFKGRTIDTTGFTFDLPTAMHVGIAVQLDDIIEVLPFRWMVAADMHLGFNEVAGNTKLAQYSLGMELDPLAGWLPLRTGILVGGRERFAWSLGFGIHLANTFDLDFATQSIAIITNPNSFRTGSFTMGMRLRL